MAKDKNSFLLYCDLIHTVEKLSDQKAGKLLKHILKYVNDKNPSTNDLVLGVVFEPIKQQFKRDLIKYNNITERNRRNGQSGGRPKKPKEPSGLSGNPKKPKEPDSGSGTDSDSGNDNDIIIPFSSKRFLDTWNTWKKDRKERKIKKYTTRGEQAALHQLQTDSGNNEEIALQIIQKSITHGYQGLFPLKNNPQQNGTDSKWQKLSGEVQ